MDVIMDEHAVSEKLGIHREQLRLWRQQNLIRGEDFNIVKKRVVYNHTAAEKAAIYFGVPLVFFEPEKAAGEPQEDAPPSEPEKAPYLQMLIYARACGNRKYGYAYHPSKKPATIQECVTVRMLKQVRRGTKILVEHKKGSFPIFRRTVA